MNPWGVVALAALTATALPLEAQLPRVFVRDTSVVPGDPKLIWLPSALPHKPTLLGGMKLVYPDSLRRKGITGRVLLEFVVDTLGRVEPGVQVLESADTLLVAPAIEMISSARFAPGRTHGRAVRALMSMGLNVAPPAAGEGTR
ncbi:MAG TPA: energy transducer TonB [Gemmatimonadales bacterium]|nr:energy transducer TonB [Gemmatimonadales bacterium]